MTFHGPQVWPAQADGRVLTPQPPTPPYPLPPITVLTHCKASSFSTVDLVLPNSCSNNNLKSVYYLKEIIVYKCVPGVF